MSENGALIQLNSEGIQRYTKYNFLKNGSYTLLLAIALSQKYSTACQLIDSHDQNCHKIQS